MAIKYGISDRRSGKVGDLVFSITTNGNVVKERVIKVNDAKSIGQVEQRSKLANGVKALKNIRPKFLKCCFEGIFQYHLTKLLRSHLPRLIFHPHLYQRLLCGQ